MLSISVVQKSFVLSLGGQTKASAMYLFAAASTNWAHKSSPRSDAMLRLRSRRSSTRCLCLRFAMLGDTLHCFIFMIPHCHLRQTIWRGPARWAAGRLPEIEVYFWPSWISHQSTTHNGWGETSAPLLYLSDRGKA